MKNVGDTYLSYITREEIVAAYLAADVRLPALHWARILAAWSALSQMPSTVKPNAAWWVRWEIIAGVRSQNRRLRASLRAYDMWRHGDNAAAWNARMFNRRNRLRRFAGEMELSSARCQA